MGKGASGRSTHLGDHGADGGGLGPFSAQGRAAATSAGKGRAGILPAAPASGEPQWGDGGLCFHSLETIQTGSELGGSPHFRGSGWPTQPPQGDGGNWGGSGHSVGKGDSPRHSCRNLGVQVWPVATAHRPSPTWAVRSAPCPVPLPGGWRGRGVHLMPLEPPRKQRCLCVPGRCLPALPRDGWAAGRRRLPHADPASPAPWNPGPGQ